jgi:hypothetical protein
LSTVIVPIHASPASTSKTSVGPKGNHAAATVPTAKSRALAAMTTLSETRFRAIGSTKMPSTAPTPSEPRRSP